MSDTVKSFIDSLDAKTRKRLKKRLNRLKEDPYQRGQDIKKLTNWGEKVYRLRIGDIRIIYRLKGKQVEIVDIDYRGNIY